MEEQTSTDLSCLNPQIQAMIDNDDRTYKGINMSLQGNCCPPPKLMHTKISNIRSRRCKARQIIIALKSTWLSPSPLKTTTTKENKWNIQYTCTANTIYYKVYLLISMIINPGGVSSFNALSTNEPLTNFHYYCVIPENIHTPSTPRKTLWFAPAPEDFPFQGDFLWPPSPQEFPEFLNGDLLPPLDRLANLRKAKILRFWTWSWEK